MGKKKTKSKSEQANQSKLTMRLTLIMFALIPLILVSIVIGSVSISKSKSEMTSYTHDSFIQVIDGVGNSFDTVVSQNGNVLKGFSSAPIIQEALRHPDNTMVVAQAQQYTMDYFGKLDGWEGLYLADWNSTVLTHPTGAVIGKTLREGDSLSTLQNAILSASNEVFNAGIMTSPASGELIMSIYTPVYIDGEPAGFCGGAFYVNNIASSISDVTRLGLSSAYIYC